MRRAAVRIVKSTITTTAVVMLDLVDAPTVVAPYSGRRVRPDTVTLTLLDGEPVMAQVTGPRILATGEQGAQCDAHYAWATADRPGQRWPDWLRNLATAYRERAAR